MLHQNIRGLCGKKDLLEDILLENKKIDILSLSETFVANDELFDTEIRGFDFVHKGRTTGMGGGVGAYIKQGVPYVRRRDLEKKDIEILWLEISFKMRRNISLVLFIDPQIPLNIYTKTLQHR